MSNTIKLYYKDAYIQEFNAVVEECRPRDDKYAVILDRTAFYPEGGGQPGDIGVLGDTVVSDTIEEDDTILHIVDKPLPAGETVTGKIDFDRRFDFMQQHSGEHIVSGLVHAAFGYNNVGFHMGSDVVTIDFDGLLTDDDLRRIEEEANRRVWNDREIEILYPDEQELAAMEYRSKKELTGQVRIVVFPETDACACCGTHVSRTGEIGLVKILSAVKFRSGVRVEMISGRRAYNYLSMTADQNHRISVLLSAKPGETADAVLHMQEENYRLRGEVLRLEEASYAAEAHLHEGEGSVLLFREGMSADGVRKLTDAVMKTCQGCCAVFSNNGDGTYKYAMGEQNGDLRTFTKELNTALNGRGGGKPFFVQGSVKSTEEEIRRFFSR